MTTTCTRGGQYGAVLAGVKAKPFGWPSASPDPGSGRHPSAAIGSRPHKIKNTKIKSN